MYVTLIECFFDLVKCQIMSHMFYRKLQCEVIFKLVYKLRLKMLTNFLKFQSIYSSKIFLCIYKNNYLGLHFHQRKEIVLWSYWIQNMLGKRAAGVFIVCLFLLSNICLCCVNANTGKFSNTTEIRIVKTKVSCKYLIHLKNIRDSIFPY